MEETVVLTCFQYDILKESRVERRSVIVHEINDKTLCFEVMHVEVSQQIVDDLLRVFLEEV